MTAPRIIVPGATTGITRRCTQRKAFLGPWHPLVSDLWLYSLAAAQEKYQVDVHHGQLVVSHEHLLVTPTKKNLPRFVGDLHHSLSCALNELLRQEGYEPPYELFDGRKPHYKRLMDPAAQVARLIHDDLNCVAAGLVSRPEQMPGRILSFDLWRDGYLDVARPPVYFGKDQPDVRRLFLTPPPLLLLAFEGDLERLVYQMARTEEDARHSIVSARKRAPIGANEIVRIHPWNEPKTERKRGTHNNKVFAFGSLDALGLAQEAQAVKETRAFYKRHDYCRKAWKEGHRQVAFPFGTYAMCEQHGACSEANAAPDALVTRPGPTHDDVISELGGYASRPLSKETTALLQEVKNTFRSEAQRITEAAQLEFAEERQTLGKDETAPNSTIVVRHRFDRAAQVGMGKRAVTLRDSRRKRLTHRKKKRRKHEQPKHSTDPPPSNTTT